MLIPLHDPRRYCCPGESGDISHSVHLARLAAGYGTCQRCAHRTVDSGKCTSVQTSHSGDVSVPLARSTSPGLRKMPSGFRGVYLNQIGRQQAIQWAAALASVLWTEFPPVLLRAEQAAASVKPPSSRSAPVVIVGYDERPAAPDVLAGAVMGLTRMSCLVEEIGLATEPCLRFAVQHLDADAGLLITGAGCDVSGIGFDVICRHGLPPETRFLDEWSKLQQAANTRRSRSAGQLRAYSPFAAYEAQLWKRFHALRPLHVVCGATSQQVLIRLERMLARLPGRLTTIRLPARLRDLSNPRDDDVQRVSQGVQRQGGHFGVVIDEDGAGCAFLDERGQLVPDLRWQQLVVEHLLCDEPNGRIVLGTSVWDELAPRVTSKNGMPLLVPDADRVARLLTERGLAAIGMDHRLWLGGEMVTCDAIATLAVVMQLLSRSDADFSQRVAQG